VGVTYTSHWFPTEKQGTALDISVWATQALQSTTFIAPFVMAAFGWNAVGAKSGERLCC